MKKIFKTSLFIMALFLAINANAQDSPIQLGVKAGANMSNFGGDIKDTKAKFGFNVGVTLDYNFTPNVALLTGLEFTTKGAKAKDTEYTKDASANAMYLQLPVHVGYKLDVAEGTKIVFHAGPYIAYGIGGKSKSTDEGVKEKDDFFGSEEDGGFKRFDFGVGAGVGAEFGKIGVGLGYDFGLTNIAHKAEEGESFKVKNQNAYLTVGYKF